MLVQSHNDELSLLPALPNAWPDGYVSGLKARGGYEVSIEWSDGKAKRVEIEASDDGVCKLRLPQNAEIAEITCRGESCNWDKTNDPQVVLIPVKEGYKYNVIVK